MIRRRLSSRDREKLIEREGFRCQYCPFPIMAGRDRWEVVHVVPLAMGGRDDDANRACAHWKCHKIRTRQIDQPAIAKSRRIYQRHIGARVAANPLPGGRDDKLRKRVDGRVEPR